MLDIPGRIINRIRRYFYYRPILAAAKKETQNVLSTVQPSKILVICYGNIYRSPFVEQYLKQNLDLEKFSVRSAGTYPKEGRQSPEKHICMSKSYGIDLTEHRSSIADEVILSWADIIIIMDKHNWSELQNFQHIVNTKLVWLGSFAGSDVEIIDPYGRSENEAKEILDRLISCSDRFIEKILQ